jgi:hypothetical protein
VVFTRDPDTGILSFSQVLQDDTAGVDGLYGVAAMDVSPDGNYVYTAAGYWDNSIAVFERDDVSGKLTVIEALKDGEEGVDGLQSNVVTLKTYSGEDYVTIAAPTGTSLTDCQAAGNPSSTDAPAGVDFTYGFFQFTVNGVSPDGSVLLCMHLPAGANPTSYYKYGPTQADAGDHWYDFSYANGTGAQINQNTVTLHVVDGQRGDDMLTADGMIVDIGAPAFPIGTSSSGSGGNSCFIAANLPIDE